MSALLEAANLGPISVYGGRAFVMEADSSVPKKPVSDELFSPTPRYRLVSIDLAGPVREVVCEHYVPRPIGLRIDDQGGILVGPQSALLIGSLHDMRVLEGCAAHPDKGCGLGKHYAVFGWEKDSTDEVRRINRKTGEVTKIGRAQKSRICAVGGDDEVFGWCEEYIGVLHWATHSNPNAANEIEVPHDVRGIYRANGEWVLRTRDEVVVMRTGGCQRLDLQTRKLVVDTKPWFAVLGGYSSFEGSKEEVVGAAVVRISDDGEEEPIFACAPAQGSDLLALLGGADVSDLTSDGQHVVFVERTRRGSRLHCLPVDAPRVERSQRVSKNESSEAEQRHRKRVECYEREFGIVDAMAPVAPTLLGLWSGCLVDLSEGESWTTITSGLSDPELSGAPGAKLTGTKRTHSGVEVQHRLGKQAPSAPRKYELFVRREGRTNDLAACLANVVHADITAEIDLEKALGKKRAAVIRLAVGSGSSAIFVHPPAGRRCWIRTGYGKVELLQVSPLDHDEAGLAERKGASALLAALRAEAKAPRG